MAESKTAAMATTWLFCNGSMKFHAFMKKLMTCSLNHLDCLGTFLSSSQQVCDDEQLQ